MKLSHFESNIEKYGLRYCVQRIVGLRASQPERDRAPVLQCVRSFRVSFLERPDHLNYLNDMYSCTLHSYLYGIYTVYVTFCPVSGVFVGILLSPPCSIRTDMSTHINCSFGQLSWLFFAAPMFCH